MGARGFEPPATCPPYRCATGLRHAPFSPTIIKENLCGGKLKIRRPGPFREDGYGPVPRGPAKRLPPRCVAGPKVLETPRGASKNSGRLDLNQRPPRPEPGALPDCATPRKSLLLYKITPRKTRENHRLTTPPALFGAVAEEIEHFPQVVLELGDHTLIAASAPLRLDKFLPRPGDGIPLVVQ